MPPTRPGVVSVVLVDYHGLADTLACLSALQQLNWPRSRLELVVVDNAPGSGNAGRFAAEVPSAVVVESGENRGFAGGCNLGVSKASGEYIAFLNNDARPHRDWLAAAVAVLEHDDGVACVASKVLDWEGESIDYVDASLTFFGMGYKREVGQPDSPSFDEPRDVLFATGAAMVIRRDVYEAVGGFDERFFMFYEDVDLGWRLNLLGHRVRYVPQSIAYHKHHATMRRYGQWREDYLLERNALFAMYKNYEDGTLARLLPAALALAVRRGIARGNVNPHSLDLARRSADAAESVEAELVPRRTLAPVFAVDGFVEALPSLEEDRARLQAQRRVSDRALVPLFRRALEPAEAAPYFLTGYEAVVSAFGIEELFRTRRRIAIVTGEPLGQRMAGPAIRAFEMARLLSEEHDVRLASLGTCTITHPRFATESVGGRELKALEEWCDVLVFQGVLLSLYPWLQESPKIIVPDVYDPFHLETLEQAKDLLPAQREAAVDDSVAVLNTQLERGDFFLCASRRQRDFWLGQLSALGRVNPRTYDADETLDGLIAVAPFGLPDEPPMRTRSAIKGVVPGIGPDDEVVLWGGGIYNWFDPLTLIRAIDVLRRRRPQVRLFFLGTQHPNRDVPAMRVATAARDLANALGLTGTHVFFNEGWVDYADRQNYLLDADLGVSTHLDHVETTFSFRTRILDYLWAGLPIVSTEGDSFADLVERESLGATVPARDVPALADALERLLADDELRGACRKRVAEVARDFTWRQALAPLVEFCRDPHRAPDLTVESEPVRPAEIAPPPPPPPHSWRGDVELARRYLRQGGVGEVVHRAAGRIRRVVRERLAA